MKKQENHSFLFQKVQTRRVLILYSDRICINLISVLFKFLDICQNSMENFYAIGDVIPFINEFEKWIEKCFCNLYKKLLLSYFDLAVSLYVEIIATSLWCSIYIWYDKFWILCRYSNFIVARSCLLHFVWNLIAS